MSNKSISRRRFLEGSIATGLAMGRLNSAVPMAFAESGQDADQGMSLRVTGSSEEGFAVEILFDGSPIANSQGGCSAMFQNEDRSLTDQLRYWKAKSWKGSKTRVDLIGEFSLKNLNTTVLMQVEYSVVTPNVVSKSIKLCQSDMLMLFYQVSHRLEPRSSGAAFWSFDQATCKPGPLHDYFPAAGFRTNTGLTLGLLTDSGYRNQWSRLIRRDGHPVKPAPRVIPDVRLYEVVKSSDHADAQPCIQQTFGEALVQQDGPGKPVDLPPAGSWRKLGKVEVKQHADAVTLSARTSADGVLIPFAAAGGDVYFLRVEYCSPIPLAMEIWDVDEQCNRLTDVTLFNDSAPAAPGDGSSFETKVMLPALKGTGGALIISIPRAEESSGAPESSGDIHLRAVELRRVETRTQPYHRLEMDISSARTSFIFADKRIPDTLRGRRLASQLHLADALGFQGGETEKVLYADLMMLCWIAGPEDFEPICAPSIWYSAAGEMYLRDSFFALNGIHDRVLNERVFQLWAHNQGPDGAINTLVEPNLANLERKSNDSTPLWLMWALLNRRRFSTHLPEDKLKKAAQYCLTTYDPDRSGRCRAQFVMGQLDVIRYPEGTSVICENQGLLAVTLRAIQQLRIAGVSEHISEDYIAKAEAQYRSYYDPALQFLRPARDISDAVGFAEIFPEFLSLWLFDRKILDDAMVIHHLDRIPLMMPNPKAPYPETGGTVRPILIGLPDGGKHGWRYFTEHWHPMVSDSFAKGYANNASDGVYYNGGSWMRIEVCGYITGKLHGWQPWETSIKNRLWAELNTATEFPTSQEYLATEPRNPFYGFHRVFAWNAFVLGAMELAGLRKPEMDPDFRAQTKGAG